MDVFRDMDYLAHEQYRKEMQGIGKFEICILNLIFIEYALDHEK